MFNRFLIPQKIDLILIVRGILAISVLVWHCGGYLYPINELSFLMIPGRMAVWLFFVLSGYLIGSGFKSGRYAFNSKGILDFYRNRLLRIMPLFWLISVTVFIFKPDLVKSLSIQFFLEQITMIQWNHQYDLNGVFWTLGIEMQFYLFAPLMCFFQFKPDFKLKKSILIYMGFLLLPIVSKFYFKTSFDIRALYGSLAVFQIGIMGSQISKEHVLFKSKQNFFMLLWAFLISLFLGNLLYAKNAGAFISPVGLVLVSGIGFLLICLHKLVESLAIPQNVITKVLSVFGVLSYGIYAWHTVIMLFFPESSVFMVFGLTCLVSIFTYFFLEKPTHRLKVKT